MCATNSVQCGWQVSKACCREGDDFSIIPQNHRVFEEKGLQAPFKSKWVGHVLSNAIEETPGLLYQCEDSYTESLCCDSAFAHKKKFYIFKFPKRFSEIS